AQATINLFYDEDQVKKTQLKQTLGVGLTYRFNNSEKLKQKEINLPPPPTLEDLNEALIKAQDAVQTANLKLQEAEQKLKEATEDQELIEETIEETIEEMESTSDIE